MSAPPPSKADSGGYRFTVFRTARPRPKTRADQDHLLATGKDAKKQAAHGAAVATAVATLATSSTPASHLFPPNSPGAQSLWVNPSARSGNSRRQGLQKAATRSGWRRQARRGRRGWCGCHRGAQLSKKPKQAKKWRWWARHYLRHRGISIKRGVNALHDLGHGGAAAVIATVALQHSWNCRSTDPTCRWREHAVVDAQRPGDVLTQYAEPRRGAQHGRRGPAGAGRRHRPGMRGQADYLIETSTLTGAQTVALGARIPGVMGSEAFRDRWPRSRNEWRERWPMPLPDELKDDLKSTVADLANVSGSASPACWWPGLPARIRRRRVAWAHIDVAGRHTTPAARGIHTQRRHRGTRPHHVCGARGHR